MEENKKEIVSDAYIYNTHGNTLALKGKQKDEYAHTNTHTFSLSHSYTHTHRESMLFL